MNSGKLKQLNKIEFAKLVLIGLSILVVVLLFMLLLRSAIEMLLLIFAGILFSIFIRGIREFLFHRLLPLPEKVGIAAAVFLILLALTAFVVLLAPRLTVQGEKLIQHLPAVFEDLRHQTEAFDWLIKSLQSWGKIQTQNAPGTITAQALGFFSTTFGLIVSTFIIIFVGLYLAFSPTVYISGMLQLLPSGSRKRAAEVFQALGYILQQWLIGRFIAMLFVTVFIFCGLYIMRIPMAYSLAILAGLLTFIPNFGPIASSIPGILMGFSLSPLIALYVGLLYLIVHFVDGFIITPLVQKQEVLLPPVLTLGAQVVLGSMLGLLGLALATPLTAAAMVLVKMLYVEDVLNEDVEINGIISEETVRTE